MGGFGVKVQHFPLTLLVVLTTLTLPCERDLYFVHMYRPNDAVYFYAIDATYNDHCETRIYLTVHISRQLYVSTSIKP